MNLRKSIAIQGGRLNGPYTAFNAPSYMERRSNSRIVPYSSITFFDRPALSEAPNLKKYCTDAPSTWIYISRAGYLTTRSQINVDSTVPGDGGSLRNDTRFGPSKVNHLLRSVPTALGIVSISM